MRKNCIVIPALEPDERLYEYVIKLMGCIRACIVVVDDGSGPGYRLVFDRIREMRNCVVLKHDVNRGKGRALKTAFSYLMEHVPEAGQIVCVDCDGQHAPGDVSRIFRAAKEEPGAGFLRGNCAVSFPSRQPCRLLPVLADLREMDRRHSDRAAGV